MIGREYLRISFDKSKTERSQDEQHDDNARACTAQGITLGEPYRENGSASASRYATKARAEFDRLLADLEHDRFGADLLVLWESSRGSRTVDEWVRLVKLCERRGVKVFVTTHGHTYDPANPRDRRSLLEDAVDSEYESAKVSMRVKRALAANAAAGKPAGRIPFGYQREYDPRTGKFAAQMEEPTEAKVIRELFARLHKGHSLRSIAADFEARGVRSRTGKVFSPQYLRSFAVNHCYVGERVHDPERLSAHKLSGKATFSKATWPALVDRETFFSVQRRLTAPERKTTRPGRGVHLLSMIAHCDVCGGPLTARTSKERKQELTCRDKGCVRVNYAELTDLVERIMLEYLAREGNQAWLKRATSTDAELTAVRGEIAQTRAELDEAERAEPATVFEARTLAGLIERLAKRLRDAEAREIELSTPSTLRGLIKPGKDVRRRWKAAPMSARREVARLLLSPAVLGELRVTRSTVPNRPCPVEDRVVWADAVETPR